MAKFKVGDRVKYVSGQFGDDYINPVWGGTEGKILATITHIDLYYSWSAGDHQIIVKWDNGRTNCYVESDLELVTKPKFCILKRK